MRFSYLALAALGAAMLPTVFASSANAQCGAIANCGSCPNPSICDACEAGRFFVVPPGGSPTCQTCTVCQSGQVETSECSPFIDRTCGATCPEGTVNVSQVCTDCGVLDCATCSAPGTCTACMPGYTLSGNTCVACTSCSAGSGASGCTAGQPGTCATCEAGTASDGSTPCTPCAAGRFSGAGATACTPCAAGTYAAGTGATACDTCPTAAGSGATTCPPESVCGDGEVEGAEECDDGDEMDEDGCSQCAVDANWTCTGAPSDCAGICGDGYVVDDEQCDDGNANDKDGCSRQCRVETGYRCNSEPSYCSRNPSGGCSTAGDGMPALPWLVLPIAFVLAVIVRRRLA